MARIYYRIVNDSLCRDNEKSILLASLPRFKTHLLGRRSSPVPYDTSIPGSEHQQWLDEAQSGSTEAIGWLFAAYQPGLLKIAIADEERLLRTKVDAEDLVQQVFLQAYRNWQQFQGETPAELLAWLRQILRHTMSNLSRWFHSQKHDVRREIPFAESNSSVVCTQSLTEGDGASGNETMGRDTGGGQAGVVERILARLPEDYRRVIVLRIREDRSFAQIAGLMGRSPAAVRKLLSRALEKTRKNLERHT